MSFNEFSEWRGYYNLEPFAADRHEFQISRLGHIISGSNGCELEKDYFLISQHNTKKESKKNDLEKQLSSFFGAGET